MDQGFFRTSENAIKTQIWIAISVCVLVTIMKKHLNLHASRYQILQILGLTIFERIELNQLPTSAPPGAIDLELCNQLKFFDQRWGTTAPFP